MGVRVGVLALMALMARLGGTTGTTEKEMRDQRLLACWLNRDTASLVDAGNQFFDDAASEDARYCWQRAYLFLGRQHQQKHDHTRALGYLTQAITLGDALGTPIPLAFTSAAESLLALDRVTEAQEALVRVQALEEKLTPLARAVVEHDLGVVAWMLGQPDEARGRLHTAEYMDDTMDPEELRFRRIPEEEGEIVV